MSPNSYDYHPSTTLKQSSRGVSSFENSGDVAPGTPDPFLEPPATKSGHLQPCNLDNLFKETSHRSNEPIVSNGGFSVDVLRLKQYVLKLAAESGRPVPDIWQDAQRLIALQVFDKLVGYLPDCLPPPPDYCKLSSGVSYVIESESQQFNVPGNPSPLPHLTIRPPGLTEKQPAVFNFGQELFAVVLPLKDENVMKSYLLYPDKRQSILDSAGGHCEVLHNGVRDLPRLFHDKIFICLHFKLEGHGHLQATSSIESSTIQVGLMLRKGVGGTCPMRAGAKQLQAMGVLDVLLDDAPHLVVCSADDGDSSPITYSEEDGIDELLTEMQEGSLYSSPSGQTSRVVSISNSHHRLSVYTLSGRLELYCVETLWHTLSHDARCQLYATIRSLERSMLDVISEANHRRLTDRCHELQEKMNNQGSLLMRMSSVAEEKMLHDSLFSSVQKGEKVTVQLHCRTDGLVSVSLRLVEDETAIDFPFSTCVMVAAACIIALESCFGCSWRSAAATIPWPYYLISTRDCFSHRLVPLRNIICGEDERCCVRTEYFFAKGEEPADYSAVTRTAIQRAEYCGDVIQSVLREVVAKVAAVSRHPDGLLPTGVTTYTDVYTLKELENLEACADRLQKSAEEEKLPSTCYHTTVTKSGGLKRTKYFFGARYLWTREQISSADSHVAGGVRVDVPAVQNWMKEFAEAPMVASGVLQPGWVDSVALNMYHDGSEGIQSHYDDSNRFDRPIHSLRLFSDSRLSFGTQLYGYTNGAFMISMPRGCVTVMEQGGYAADGVKHCVRPADMSIKSAGMVMRRINPNARRAAEELFVNETTHWFRELSITRETPSSWRLNYLLSIQDLSRKGQIKNGGVVNSAKATVCRVMEHMIRHIESGVKSEQMDQMTGRLMLLSAVGKVVAASRMAVDITEDSEAVECFSTLDDIVSWVERPYLAAGSLPGSTRKRSLVGDLNRPTSSKRCIVEHIVDRVAQKAKEIIKKSALDKVVCPQSEGTVLSLKRKADGDPSAVSVRASKKKPHQTKVPLYACFACYKGLTSSDSETEWACAGSCRRTFHFECVKPASVGGPLGSRCENCTSSTHACFVCGKPPSSGHSNREHMEKCSLGSCGRYFHSRCIRAHPLSRPAASGKSIKCMLHYCTHCTLSGDGMAMVQCINCPVAYHLRCRPSGIQQLSKKLILCPKCTLPG